jgi:hypothetical protein
LISGIAYRICQRAYLRFAPAVLEVMALSTTQSSSQGFSSHTLESMPVVKYGKRHQENLQEIHLEMYVSKQRTSTTESLGNVVHQHLHAATGSEGRHNLAGATDVRGATTEVVNIPDERMWPESSDQPLTCSICTEDFHENHDVRILPCSHIYHSCCIDPWLLDFGRNCPLW